jgi:hypothetical protein
MGEEVGTMQFLDFKGEYFLKQMMNERKFKGDVRDLQGESHVTEYMTEKNE